MARNAKELKEELDRQLTAKHGEEWMNQHRAFLMREWEYLKDLFGEDFAAFLDHEDLEEIGSEDGSDVTYEDVLAAERAWEERKARGEG